MRVFGILVCGALLSVQGLAMKGFYTGKIGKNAMQLRQLLRGQAAVEQVAAKRVGLSAKIMMAAAGAGMLFAVTTASADDVAAHAATENTDTAVVMGPQAAEAGAKVELDAESKRLLHATRQLAKAADTFHEAALRQSSQRRSQVPATRLLSMTQRLHQVITEGANSSRRELVVAREGHRYSASTVTLELEQTLAESEHNVRLRRLIESVKHRYNVLLRGYELDQTTGWKFLQGDEHHPFKDLEKHYHMFNVASGSYLESRSSFVYPRDRY